MQRSLKDLEQYAVNATDGAVGHVVDFLLDDEHWTVRYLVVETGGFFGGHRVLISPIAFRDVDWSTHEFHVALTMDAVKNSPVIDTDKPVSRQHERALNRYYGYPFYWNASAIWGMGIYPGLLAGVALKDAPVEPLAEHENGDAHLRSAHELRHYQVQGTDDTIGHVDDFIVDEATWGVQYLVVDTSDWWFGKRVLVAPRWAHRVSWQDRNVQVAMTRDAIANSPEWDGAAAVNREYEQRLYDYYGRPVYWGSEGHPGEAQPSGEGKADAGTANPPRTTSYGWWTAPKFGSAGSGGLEIEPGAERD